MQQSPRDNVDMGELRKFLIDCQAIIGATHVLTGDADRDSYRDGYSFGGDEHSHRPGAAVAPANAEEVAAVVKAAAKRGVPLWPISRGKNLGYGGSAPALSGTVILDMSRMNRIHEVDAELGYAVIEPGVGFYDLFSHLRNNGIPLWMSCPEQSWGSIMGNALDRGVARTPYGEHSQMICGMEVVLGDGSIVRTGMGAMSGNRAWHAYKNGFGPSWDQMFMQSNFGIVTKVGIWLMHQPPATTTIGIVGTRDDDFEWLTERLIAAMRRGYVDQFFALINGLMAAAFMTSRAAWYDGKGPMPPEVTGRMLEKIGAGWWNTELTLYGDPQVNAAKERALMKLFSGRASVRVSRRSWEEGQPLEASGASMPTTIAFQIINWYGGRGGHMGFSPILPTRADEIVRYVRMAKTRVEAAGRDFTLANHMTSRYVIAVTELIYDRDDAVGEQQLRALFDQLIDAAAKEGYGEYRTHVAYMDRIAATYDFNNNALLRLNERLKDAVDPAGVIAPGKSGIWPKRFRSEGAA